jgi:hypothetical protein
MYRKCNLRKIRASRLVLALCLAAVASGARAATGDVLFNATVDPTCTLTVNADGTMTVSTDLQSLSSHNAGGSPGSVTASTTGGVTLSVDPVSIVTAPAGDTTTTAWTPTYSATGAQFIGETGAPTAVTASGSLDVSVNLAGTKSGSDRFVAGNYQATVTVRCE